MMEQVSRLRPKVKAVMSDLEQLDHDIDSGQTTGDMIEKRGKDLRKGASKLWPSLLNASTRAGLTSRPSWQEDPPNSATGRSSASLAR
jgi:hypothetical protein